MARTRRIRVALLGSKALGLAASRAIRELADLASVITAPDTDDQRSRLADLTAEGALVAETRQEALTLLNSLDADLVVVAGWYWIIPEEQLRRSQFIGIHHSLLPRYRGGSPLVWALLAGEHVVGTSLFTLTAEVDAGPIWGQARVAAGDGYIGDVSQRCDDAALDLLPVLFDPRTRPKPQDSSKATVRPPRHPSDGLIDWTMSAPDVQRWIRAQSRPYPGAFTYLSGERMTIWRAQALTETATGSPGQVVDAGVVCGDKCIIAIQEADRRISKGARLDSGPR